VVRDDGRSHQDRAHPTDQPRIRDVARTEQNDHPPVGLKIKLAGQISPELLWITMVVALILEDDALGREHQVAPVVSAAARSDGTIGLEAADPPGRQS
jgi:hypothetical protein